MVHDEASEPGSGTAARIVPTATVATIEPAISHNACFMLSCLACVFFTSPFLALRPHSHLPYKVISGSMNMLIAPSAYEPTRKNI